MAISEFGGKAEASQVNGDNLRRHSSVPSSRIASVQSVVEAHAAMQSWNLTAFAPLIP